MESPRKNPSAIIPRPSCHQAQGTAFEHIRLRVPQQRAELLQKVAVHKNHFLDVAGMRMLRLGLMRHVQDHVNACITKHVVAKRVNAI